MKRNIITALAAAPLAVGMAFTVAPAAHAAPQSLGVMASSDGTNLNITVTGCDTSAKEANDRATALKWISSLAGDQGGMATSTSASYSIAVPLSQIAGDNVTIVCEYYQGKAQTSLAIVAGDGKVDGTVWTDRNDDGIFGNGGDSVVPNAPWMLTDIDGMMVMKGKTDANGHLKSAALADGVYTLTVDAKDGKIVYTVAVIDGIVTLTKGTPAHADGKADGKKDEGKKDEGKKDGGKDAHKDGGKATTTTTTTTTTTSTAGKSSTTTTASASKPGLANTGAADAAALPFAGIALVGAAAAGAALIARKK